MLARFTAYAVGKVFDIQRNRRDCCWGGNHCQGALY